MAGRVLRGAADATTFTFKLKSGLKWNDGTPLTSADVLFTYNLVANPKAKSAAAGLFASVVGAKEVVDGKADTVSGLSAPDDQTFVIKTTEPNYGLLAQIGTIIVLPEHVLGEIPLTEVYDNDYFRNPKVTSGPFKFVEYKTSQYVHVVANPEANPAPKLAEVYLKPMTSDVATAELGNGGLDVATVSPLDLETLAGFDQIAVQEKLGAGFVRIGINQSRDYFKDKRVRQAFLYAVDRADLVNKVLNGKAEVRNSDFYTPRAPKDLNAYAYDPAQGQAAAGRGGLGPGTEITCCGCPASGTGTPARRSCRASSRRSASTSSCGRSSRPRSPRSRTRTSTWCSTAVATTRSAPDNVAVITSCESHYPKGGNINYFCDPELDKIMKEAERHGRRGQAE